MMSTSRASRGSKDKSTKTHTAQKGPSQNAKPDPPTMNSKQIQATAEQMRIASAINNDRNEEDPEVQQKIQLVKEIYGNISDDTIFFTLHEHDFDLNKAVNALGDKQNPPADGKWESAATKKQKKSSKADIPPVMDKPERGEVGERGVSSGRGSNRRDKGPPRFQRGRGRENSEGGRRRGPDRGGQPEDGEAESRERNNFGEGRAGRGRGRGGGRGGGTRGRGGRFDRNVGGSTNLEGARSNLRAPGSGMQSQFDSFETHIDTWSNEVAENAEKGSNNIGSWQEDWTADEWQGSLEQSTVFTASSTNDTSSSVFQTDSANNDNDAKMFSVSAIETQVFTAKSLPSNEGSKNSYGLGAQTTNSSGQPINSVGTIGQQHSNQNAGTIGQNSLGQKAMGSSQQPSQLGQRLNIEDLLPKTVTPPATAPMTGTEFLSQYAAKKAEEDIRSAVGIRPPTQNSAPPPATAPISRPPPQQQQQDNRQQQQLKKTRLPPPSKIPASAVEMPGGANYKQDAVQVQFGNWDSDTGGFSFGAGTTDNASTNGNHFNGHSASSNPPSSQPIAQALTSTAMSSGRGGLESSPRSAASANYPNTPPKQQANDSAFPPTPTQQQQEQRKASPYASSSGRQQQQQAATGSLGAGNKPLSASYNQSGFSSPSSGSSAYPGSSYKSQSLSQSASAGYPSSSQRGESGSSSQYESPRSSSSYSSQQQQQQATSESVSSSSFQQSSSSQQYTSASSSFQQSSASSPPTSTFAAATSNASGDSAVSAAGGSSSSSYQGSYNSSSNYQPSSSAFHRSSGGSDYQQQGQQSGYGESRSQQQQSYNSSNQYHAASTAASSSSGYRDSSSVSSGGASTYGAPAAGFVSSASPQGGNSALNKLTNSLAKMATKDSDHESSSAASQQQQYEQSVSSAASAVSSSVISSSSTATTSSNKQAQHNTLTTKAPPNLPPGVPPVLAPFNMMGQHGLSPAFYNIANLQQQQQPPQPDAAAAAAAAVSMYNLDHLQMLQQQGRFPPMPGTGYHYDMPALQPNLAAAVAAAQQIQAPAPSTIPDQKLSAGYPGESKMTRLEAQSPVNAISTSQHGNQPQQQQGQQAQPQQSGQSQNPAFPAFPPGYYNYYAAANNPPVLPGGYSYPPNMFPVGHRGFPPNTFPHIYTPPIYTVPSVTSHGGAGSSSQYGKPATYPTGYNNYDPLAVAAAAQQQQQDYKNKGAAVSQSSSVSDGLGGGSYGVSKSGGSGGYDKSFHHAAGTPPPPGAGAFTSLLQATSNSNSSMQPTPAGAGAYGAGPYVVPSHTHVAAAAGMVQHHLPQDSLSRGASGQSSSGAPKNKYQTTPYWSN